MASSSKAQPTSGPLHRLVRTLSGKQTAVNAQPVSPILSAQVIPPSVSEELSTSDPSNASSTTESHEPKERALLVDFIDRFKNLNLGEKFKKAKTSREDPGPVISNTVDPSLSVVPDTGPPIANTDDNAPDTSPAGPSIPPDDPAEPTYLARKIQALIDALPLPSSPTSPPTPRPPPKRDASGRPIPPPDATPIKDSGFIAMLSSATIMNGSSSSSRPSVWSILESLGAPKHGSDPAEPEGNGDQDVGAEPEDPGDGGSVFSDGSSLMMYSPLLPTQSSLVELADTEVLSVDESSPGSSSGETDAATGLAAWMGMWPFNAWGGMGGSTEKQEEIVPQLSAGPSYTPSSPDRRAHYSALPDINIPESGPDGSVSNGRFQTQGQRVWVPSTTKLSLQAMWWGYRLYLPPPVLEILSDKQIEATKRAAMITSALTWFFSHLPISSLPIAVRPALLLLQTLVPYVGYIGTFISWSWSTIKSYDTGHGVILTATWLLPVALIPGTWEERDFPPASPAPAPPPSLPPSNPTPAPTPSPAPAPAPAPPTQPTPPPPAPPTQPTPPPQTPCSPPTSPLPSIPAPPPHSSPQPPPAPSPPTIPLPPASEPPTPPTPPAPSPPTIPLPDMVPVSPVIGALWKGKEREREREHRHGERKEKDRLGKAKARAMGAIKGLRGGGGGDGAAR